MENINWMLLVNHAQRELCNENIDWNSKDAVMKAVQQNGMNLQYASEKLRNNKNITLAAIRQDGAALEYASEKLRNNKK